MVKLKKTVAPLVMVFLAFTLILQPVEADASNSRKDSKTTKYQGNTLTWTGTSNGEVLSKVQVGNVEYTYTYNENRNRITKTSADQSIALVYDDESKLISETRGSDIISYHYDEMSALVGFTLHGESYYYVKDENLSVIAITDATGQEISRYSYDQQGLVKKILGLDKNGSWVDRSNDSSFIGTLNLIRLHSFYYDAETNWYYNGIRYYDPDSNKYVGGTDHLDQISTFEKFLMNDDSTSARASQELVVKITQWRQSLMNDSNFGKPLSYSSNWYSNLSDVELLSRLIYGENTSNTADQNAVGWVLINRKNANFSNGTYRGIATQSGQFEPITGDNNGTDNARVPNTSSSRWSNAVWIACTLLSTSYSQDYLDLIPKPTGITDQLYFTGLNYFLTVGINDTPVGSGLRYKFGSSQPYIDIQDVVIVFTNTSTFQNPGSIEDIKQHNDLNTVSKRNNHNIFFNE